MAQPNSVLNPLFRQFQVIALLVNTVGMMMSFIYLESLNAFPGGGTVFDHVPPSVLAAFTVILAAVTALNIWWRQKRNSELRQWQQRLAGGADPATVPLGVYRQVLNYASAAALLNLASWSAVAFVLGIIVALAAGAARLFFITLFGLIGTSGLITSAGIYFGTELMWRQAIPAFFPQDKVSHIPGVIRLSVLARLVLGFFLTAILPRFFLTNLSYRQAQQLLAAADPQAALANWLNLELFFLVVTSAASIVLAILVTRGIVWPLRQMQAEMGRVQQNDFTTRTAVTTTDELGFLGERFNEMVAALERRNRELATVYQISQDIAANLELDRTLSIILERVRQMIAYDAAEICLFDSESHELRGRAYAGPNGIRLGDGRELFSLGMGHAGQLIEKRESVLLTAVTLEDQFVLEGIAAGSFLAAPLVAGPKLVGSLALIGRGAFDQHDRQLLETIAPQAAIAIDNAAQIIEREKGLREEIRLLRIEIDQAKRLEEVSQIKESDYFRQLQEEARRMRQQAEE